MTLDKGVGGAVGSEIRQSTLSRLLPHWTRFWLFALAALCAGFVGYLLLELAIGDTAAYEIPGLGAGVILFSILTVLVLRRALVHRIARDAVVESGRLVLHSAGKTVGLSPGDIRSVVRLRSNPMRREWPLALWRRWFRIDVQSGPIYLTWQQEPEAFLSALVQAGFNAGDQREWNGHDFARGNPGDAVLLSAQDRTARNDMLNAAALFDIGKAWARRFDETGDPAHRLEALTAMREAVEKDPSVGVGYYDAGFGTLMKDPDFRRFSPL